MMINKLTLCFTLLTLSACSGNFYTIPTPDYDPKKYEVIGQVQEVATGVHISGIIPIKLNNKIQRAIEVALRSRGGDAITNLRVRERWFWAYILNGYRVDIEGTVLRKKSELSK